MKAIVYHQYGTTNVLHPEEVEQPIPKDNEVLVRVHAASVNSWDYDLVTGKPRIYRLMFGLFKPKHKIIGSDISGTVVSAGKNATTFKPGDEVFGDISASGFGAFAEYSCANEKYLALKPEELSFEEAASIPQAGLLALQGLRQGKIHKGQNVLINGAGGGVGTLAIQLAKLWGAKVTAVDLTEKFELMRSLGASHVIDYTKEDFTQQEQQYDLILDAIAKHPVFHYKRPLAKHGHFVVVGGSVATMLQVAFLGWLAGRSKKQTMAMMPQKINREDLAYLADLCAKKKISPVVDRVFPMEETAQAVQYLGDGRVKGKLVISI